MDVFATYRQCLTRIVGWDDAGISRDTFYAVVGNDKNASGILEPRLLCDVTRQRAAAVAYTGHSGSRIFYGIKLFMVLQFYLPKTFSLSQQIMLHVVTLTKCFGLNRELIVDNCGTCCKGVE